MKSIFCTFLFVLFSKNIKAESFNAKDTLEINKVLRGNEIRFQKTKSINIDSIINASNISEKIGFTQGELRANLLLGKFYNSRSLSVKANEFFLRALVNAEKLSDKKNESFLTVEIGGVFYRLQNYQEALKYFKKHQELTQKYGTTEEYLLSFNNLGIVFFDQGDYQNALKYFKICEKGSDSLNSNKLKTVSLINVAMVYAKTKKYKEAYLRYEKAINIEDGYRDRISFVKNQQAKILILQNKLTYAEIIALEGLKYCVAPRSIIREELCLTLTEIYNKTQNKTLELKYYKEYYQIKLHQDSTKTNQLIKFMDLDYTSKKQSDKISGLSESLLFTTNQRDFSLLTVILMLILLVIIFSLFKKYKAKNIFIEKQKQEIEKLNFSLEEKVIERTQELSFANAELITKNFEITEALFKGQSIERKRVAAELHDNLGGTISALKWRLGALNANALSPKEKEIYDSIKIMMGSAYDEIRHISHNLLPPEFEKYGLIGALEKLINEINDNGKIEFEFIIKGSFAQLENKLALEIYSVCLELINNTLKHSQATKGLVNLKITKGKIHFKICDNGIGIQTSEGFGKGFVNIKERLNHLGGSFKVEKDKDWRFIFEGVITF